MAETIVIPAVTKLVRTAIGLVCNVVLDQSKHKDVAKESIHEIIFGDLKVIKSRLDCLSLKELDSSYSFLKEGVELLNLAIDSASKDENESPPGEASRISKDCASDVLKEAPLLRKAIQGLNISSKERFLSAKGRFEDSRKEATRAFNNKSLGIANRIIACKLHVAATILELGLEDPQAAVTASLVPLKALHGLPQIQDMFSVVLKGGIKSRLKTEERLGNIMSVLFINHALFNFASKHSSEYPNVFTWPEIKIRDRKVSPIVHALEILEKTSSSGELSRQLSRIVIREIELFFDFALNSRSEAVVIGKKEVAVIKNAGEREVVLFPVTSKRSVVHGKAIAVDYNDNVYALRFVQALDGKSIKDNLVLYVFDENYDLKHETTLDFLHAEQFNHAKIAVDRNANIIMIQEGDNHVYVCDSKGQLKFQFERDSSKAFSLSTTHHNDIMITSDDQRSVHVYTAEGTLKSTVKTPKGHEIEEVAFHHGMNKVIVLTYVKEQKHRSLLCYSETGEQENLEVLCDESKWNVKSHSSGLFAVRLGKCISFI